MQTVYMNDRPIRFIPFLEDGRTRILFLVDDAARVFDSRSVRNRAKCLGNFIKEEDQPCLNPDLLVIHQSDLDEVVGDLIDAANDLLPTS
jgi:hypothetical protein